MDYKRFDKFYIFGAGGAAKRCKTILVRNNKEVVSFLVSQGSAGKIENISVINLSLDDQETDKTIPIIIGVFNRNENAHMGYITDYLNAHGFQIIINFFRFIEEFSSKTDSFYWLTNRDFYKENMNVLLSVKELFREEKSKSVFESVISFLNTFNIDDLPQVNASDQYFPANIDIWDGKNAFLDIGSFNGQTIIDAYNIYGKLDIVIAYEPDPFNFRLINQNAALIDMTENLFLIPCGVWSKTQILNFSAGFGESSIVEDSGNMHIQCLALDETLFGIKPGYLKMDIEGAEYNALIGGKEIIKKFKPSLAICLYHHPSHLFEIPLLIKSWDLEYQFFIRLHGNNLFETVLYCVAKK